jgi:hypothetical protein
MTCKSAAVNTLNVTGNAVPLMYGPLIRVVLLIVMSQLQQYKFRRFDALQQPDRGLSKCLDIVLFRSANL